MSGISPRGRGRYTGYDPASEIRTRIANLESKDVMLSFEAQERTMKFYIDSAEEMGVSIHEELMKEWLPRSRISETFDF